jgi:hypothetical protein
MLTIAIYCFHWRATRELNPGPLVPETNALSTELVALMLFFECRTEHLISERGVFVNALDVGR